MEKIKESRLVLMTGDEIAELIAEKFSKMSDRRKIESDEIHFEVNEKDELVNAYLKKFTKTADQVTEYGI